MRWIWAQQGMDNLRWTKLIGSVKWLLDVLSEDDLAEEFEDVDFADAGAAADDEGWETEDEMDADQDDSELTFSNHTGNVMYTGNRVMTRCFFWTCFGNASSSLIWLDWKNP